MPSFVSAALPATCQSKPLVYGAGKFFLPVTGGIAESADGFAWSMSATAVAPGVYPGEDIQVQVIQFTNGLFFAVSTGTTYNRFATSPDHITWTWHTSPSSVNWAVSGTPQPCFAYASGLWAIIAPSGPAGYYGSSLDSLTFFIPPNSGSWNSGITSAGPRFVAVTSNSNKLIWSTDGSSWTTVTMPSSFYTRIASNGSGTLVVVKTSGTAFAYSTNSGDSWTTGTLPASPSGGWYTLKYGGGYFLLADYSSTTTLMSANGISWTSVAAPSFTGSRIFGEAGGGNFVLTLSSADSVFAYGTPLPPPIPPAPPVFWMDFHSAREVL